MARVTSDQCFGARLICLFFEDDSARVPEEITKHDEVAWIRPKDLGNEILKEVEEFTQGMPQFDDITLMMIKFI